MFMKKFKFSAISSVIFLIIFSSVVPLLKAQEQSEKYILPVRYDEYRFFAEPVLENGKKMKFSRGRAAKYRIGILFFLNFVAELRGIKPIRND